MGSSGKGARRAASGHGRSLPSVRPRRGQVRTAPWREDGAAERRAGRVRRRSGPLQWMPSGGARGGALADTDTRNLNRRVGRSPLPDASASDVGRARGARPKLGTRGQVDPGASFSGICWSRRLPLPRAVSHLACLALLAVGAAFGGGHDLDHAREKARIRVGSACRPGRGVCRPMLVRRAAPGRAPRLQGTTC